MEVVKNLAVFEVSEFGKFRPSVLGLPGRGAATSSLCHFLFKEKVEEVMTLGAGPYFLL
jgi:hypothetical protein